jgi:two-component system phosphate regulon response regulator PhoB
MGASRETEFTVAVKQILVIEDDPDIVEVLVYNLTREGYEVVAAESGEDGLSLARAHTPDLVLLDLMLPGMEGLQVCRALKNDPATRGVPVIMLTAKTEDADIVTGLEMGADDYITKPFSPRVLTARVRAVLRRPASADESEDQVIRIGPLEIDPRRYQVSLDGKRVALTQTEFRLLQVLASRPGWVFTRDQLVNLIRGEDVMVTDRTIDVHVAGVRKKLGPAGRRIATVRGVGYRFEE